MIFSRKHKLLYIKGRKVASTSIEISLSKICDSEDIITPLTPADEKLRLSLDYKHAQNYGAENDELENYINQLRQTSIANLKKLKPPKGSYRNHLSLNQISQKLGDEIKDIRIIAVTRSPYQYICSMLNFRAQRKLYQAGEKKMQISQLELQKSMPRLIESIENKSLKRNYDLYKVPERLESQINVHTIRFENISTALNTYLESQDIPRIDLPHAKKGGGFKDKFILEIVTPLQLSKINDYFSEEFRDFNYPKLRFV